MKRFLSRIVFLVFVILFVNIIMFLIRSRDVRSYTKYINQEFAFRSFIFADSHGNCFNRDAESFSLHNMAYSSDSYKDILRKLENLLYRGVDIDTLVLTVDPHTLSIYREINNNNLYSITLTKEIDYYLPIFQAQYTTTLPMSVELRMRTLWKSDEDKKKAITYSNLSKSEKEIAALKRLNQQFPTKKSSTDLENDLNKILQICKKNEIKIYGIRFPLPREYSLLLEEDYGAAKILESQNIPILDYQNISLPDTCYKDIDHLNFDGGLELLKMMKGHLKKPTNISADGF